MANGYKGKRTHGKQVHVQTDSPHTTYLEWQITPPKPVFIDIVIKLIAMPLEDKCNFLKVKS